MLHVAKHVKIAGCLLVTALSIRELICEYNSVKPASAMEPVAATPDHSPFESSYQQVYRVTAYCDQGLTASGIWSGVGQCAAPADIPFGSRIYIPALDQTFIVTDRTHKRFRHNTVDLFIPAYQDAKAFGRHYLVCEITPPPRPHTYGNPALALAAADAVSLIP